jgi:hypothetical protein
MSSHRNLQSAYQLMEQGQKKEAAVLVREVLAQDKNNANAWWLMALLLDDEDKKVRAIERVLSINPEHKAARAKINELRSERQTGQNMMATQEMINLDWSKLKDDPHPDKRKPKEVIDKDHKVATYAMMMLGAFLLLVIVIAGALFVMNYLNQPKLSPEETADAYINAFGTFDFDTITALTCEQFRGEAETARRNFERFIAGMDRDDLSFDFSGITLEVANQTDTQATVQIGGEFAVIAFGVESQFNVDELSDIVGDDANLSLLLENNEWRICESPN